MSNVKIYVGNIPTAARNSELKDLFEKFGKVCECDILKDFAFVHMQDTSDAKAAIAGLHDTLWKGSRIRVEISTTKTNKGEPSERKLRALESRDRYRPRGAPPAYYRESRRSPSPYREPRLSRYSERDRVRPYPDYDHRRSRLPPPPMLSRDYRSPPPYDRDPYPPRGRYPPPHPHDPYYRSAPLPPPPPPHLSSRSHRDLNDDRSMRLRYRSRSPRRSRSGSPPPLPPPRRYRVESPPPPPPSSSSRSRDYKREHDGRRDRRFNDPKCENNSSYTSSSSSSSL
ncbi:unnamed protein product [Brachionus calyciflorus]|uniref:RRM domain-containing protein n=1 Tax=Brachionus calyciflorus TaxID=104777 RepID=A0A814JJB9_9BILA|nr:unnamed protein product [Brachionus calyciflorus]